MPAPSNAAVDWEKDIFPTYMYDYPGSEILRSACRWRAHSSHKVRRGRANRTYFAAGAGADLKGSLPYQKYPGRLPELKLKFASAGKMRMVTGNRSAVADGSGGRAGNRPGLPVQPMRIAWHYPNVP